MYEPVNNTSPEDGEVHLLDYLLILAKHSRMIIYVSVAVTILNFLYLFCAPNIYKATARLFPPQQNLTLSGQLLETLRGGVAPGSSTPGGGLGSMGGMAAGLLGLRSAGDLYLTMLTSEPVLDQVIARFNLMKSYKTKSHELARKQLTSSTKIVAGKKDGTIGIEVTNKDPKLAAEMANAFIEELGRFLQSLALQEAQGRSVFLEKERLQASQNLTKAEEAVRLFSEQNSVLQLDTQTRGAIEYIARLRAEIDAKEVSIEVLRQQATPFNYDVVRLETEIKGLKEKLRSAEAQKANCVSDICLPTDKAPSLSLEYLRLYREAKFQESLYQLFTRLVEIARLDMVRDVAVVQVLAPAMPPENRSNKRLSPAILTGVVTCFIMIFMTFGWEYLQNVNTRDDDAQRLSLMKEYLRPWTDTLIKIKNKYLSK
jgi:tyrosine-protein kinase Etk/Wzc